MAALAGVLSVVLALGAGVPEWSPDTLLTRARKLAREAILVDTHIDAPYRLTRSSEDLRVRTRKGDFDYVRAREGGLDVAFMSIYTPADLEGTGRAGSAADALISRVEKLAASAPGKFLLVRTVADVRREAGHGRVLLALGMENGSPLEGKLENLKRFFDRGIRYITLAHAKDNHLADASFDTVRRWNGLSPFGRTVVEEMNRLGIMVDISHLSDSAALQAVRISGAPVIASHSSCRAFTPGFERNISDDLIRAVAAKGGVVQVNFSSLFLDDAFRLQEEGRKGGTDSVLARAGVRRGSAKARRLLQEYRREHPLRYPDVGRVADHIDHIVKIAGIDHAGFGSDFDGAGDTFPIGLKDVAQYPNLIAELLRRGYHDGEIRKLCGENLLRVWSAVERYAARKGKVQ
jgi:membrane dipeptidase